jgi:hypothetical protein
MKGKMRTMLNGIDLAERTNLEEKNVGALYIEEKNVKKCRSSLYRRKKCRRKNAKKNVEAVYRKEKNLDYIKMLRV